MTICVSAHTAVCPSRAVGALLVDVSAHVSVVGSYSPPELKWIPGPPTPPHTIIRVPVQTAL